MSDLEELNAIASRFSKDFSLEEYPHFSLDRTWPSVGTLDFILRPIRGENAPSAEAQEVLFDSSVYLALLAHECWSTFPGGQEISIRKLTGQSPSVTISALGGKYLEDTETFSANVTKSLRALLKKPPKIFKYFAKRVRPVGDSNNLLSPFGIGLVTGLFPQGVGGWKRLDEKDFIPCLEKATEFLAQSCSEYYGRSFPNESLGRNREIYRSGVVLPPILHGERYPGIRGTANLFQYAAHTETNLEDLFSFCRNLLLTPDEQLSAVGFAITAAQMEKPSRELRLAALAKSIQTKELRAAVAVARKALGQPEDYKPLIALENSKGAQSLLGVEHALNLIPLFKLPFDYISRKELLPLLEALLWFEPADAVKLIEEIKAEGLMDSQISMQETYLQVLAGEKDSAADTLSTARRNDASLEDTARYHELLGVLAIEDGDLAEAKMELEKAIQIGFKESEYQVELYNYLTGLALDLEDTAAALKLSEKTLAVDEDNPMALTNRFIFLTELGSNDAKQAQAELGRAAPLFQDIFGLLQTQKRNTPKS